MPHIVQYNASLVTARDGTGTRYLTDISMDTQHGLPFTWKREDALMFRKPGVADELLPQLRKAWPTMKIGLEQVKRRELR